jgi:hypothetical protein
MGVASRKEMRGFQKEQRERSFRSITFATAMPLFS